MCMCVYIYMCVYKLYRYVIHIKRLSERKRDKHTRTTFKTSPRHHLTQGVVRSIISEDDLLQPILSELTHVAEGGHLGDTKTFCKKKTGFKGVKPHANLSFGHYHIVHPYSSSWHIYIYIWVCLKMRSAAREVWLGGMIRGYDSGYGSGYGSGVWFAALYVPILSPKIPKTSECC